MHDTAHAFITLDYHAPSDEEVLRRARTFREEMARRRSVRHFSDRAVDEEVIAELIATASSAPSGANKQPWRFVAVSDPALKTEIRTATEKEERQSYEHRMPSEWLDLLEPLGVDWRKPYLEVAPWLVVLFQQTVEELPDGGKRKNYYVSESVGIAAGLFLAAVHQAGLVALTHTPSPMKFLGRILKRPASEKPYLLIPVGYPEEGCQVPDIQRKSLGEVAEFRTGA